LHGTGVQTSLAINCDWCHQPLVRLKSQWGCLMRIVETMQKANWPAIISRVTGVALLLAGVLLAAGLCAATPQDNSVTSIFDSHSTPADSIRQLSFFVLSVTGLIFLVVFSLLTYVVVKFRGRAADTGREPA
jgi:uncharacterized BrkB/YihY/UPF0761 family membrane protein